MDGCRWVEDELDMLEEEMADGDQAAATTTTTAAMEPAPDGGGTVRQSLPTAAVVPVVPVATLLRGVLLEGRRDELSAAEMMALFRRGRAERGGVRLANRRGAKRRVVKAREERRNRCAELGLN